MSRRYGWVRPLDLKGYGVAMFEACALLPEQPPGEGWIEVPDDQIVTLLFKMQRRMHEAEMAAYTAKRRLHAACDDLSRALPELWERR